MAARMSARPAGPRGATVPCSGCGAPLDAVRAGHVAIFNSQMRFFCNYAACRAGFLGQPQVVEREPEREAQAARRAELTEAITAEMTAVPVMEEAPLPDVVPARGIEFIEPISDPVGTEMPAAATERREVGLLLVALALIAGTLAMALELAAATQLVALARLVLLAVGTGALIGRAATLQSDAALPRRFVLALGPALATLIVVWALLDPSGEFVARSCFLAATIVTVYAVTVWLVGLPQRAVEEARNHLAERLETPAHRVGKESARELAFDVRPGEHVAVEAGETVPVDFEVLEGDAELLPWVGAATGVRRRVGDAVVAGSRLVTGSLRGRTTWVDDDRALARPLLNERRRPDVHTAVARLSRSLAERWSLIASAVVGVAVVLLGGRFIAAGMVAVAVYAALGNPAIGSLAGLSLARGVRGALWRGIVFNDASSFESCSQTTAAVFCARGTLLRGEPELVEIEVFGRRGVAGPSADDVLALAAGALATERSPVSLALRRAARSRGLAPDPVRNPRGYGNRGVTAVASTGEALCVGNRSHMLERHISVAVSEQAMSELESSGRTAILVARAGRLIGLVALQDGLRSGARAAVQHLLDAHIEPVLMSSDARETCEALGRSLDIDNLRAEVVEDMRGDEVKRLRDTGAIVAVLGHSPHDDPALAAAHASVVLAAAGGARDDFNVLLVGDDVRDGALALALAHRTRTQAYAALLLVLGPAALGCLVVGLRLLPPEYAPLAQLLGTMAAVWQERKLA